MIKIYIVTYRRNEVLNRNLRTLWGATRQPNDISVTVISNHPDIVIDEENNRNNLRVIINGTRALNSWGYLGRDWNFGILDCFTNWRNPNNIKWCVLAQNDVEWVDGWDEFLRNNEKYDFISQPTGDQSMAININGVRKVGFFDERFCTLHFQELDYFSRAIIKLGSRVSINDDHVGEESAWNPVGCVITEKTAYGIDHSTDDLHTPKSWEEMRNLFFNKWKVVSLETALSRPKFVAHLQESSVAYPKEVNWYPFFWDGYTDINSDFLTEYKPYELPIPPITLKMRLVGFATMGPKQKVGVLTSKLEKLRKP